MLRSIIVISTLLAATTAVLSQEDAIAKRRAIYKSFGQAAREPGAMLRGSQPFDLAKVQAVLRLFQDGSRQLPELFPESSKTGGDTAALPVIWEEKPRFNALFAKFGDDTEAALAAIKDEASFKAELPKVLRDCASCHDAFRAKR